MRQEVFGRPVDEAKELAQAAYVQALTINPDYAPAYTSLSLLARYNFEFAAADQYLQKAIQLGTGIAYPLGVSSSLMRTFGRFDESIDLARKPIAFDPVQPSA